jgi:hypothetical protein
MTPGVKAASLEAGQEAANDMLLMLLLLDRAATDDDGNFVEFLRSYTSTFLEGDIVTELSAQYGEEAAYSFRDGFSQQIEHMLSQVQSGLEIIKLRRRSEVSDDEDDGWRA